MRRAGPTEIVAGIEYARARRAFLPQTTKYRPAGVPGQVGGRGGHPAGDGPTISVRDVAPGVGEDRDVPFVRVVVLNWNAAWLTARCLRSLAATEYPAARLEVVVVDNASI